MSHAEVARRVTQSVPGSVKALVRAICLLQRPCLLQLHWQGSALHQVVKRTGCVIVLPCALVSVALPTATPSAGRDVQVPVIATHSAMRLQGGAGLIAVVPTDATEEPAITSVLLSVLLAVVTTQVGAFPRIPQTCQMSLCEGVPDTAR
jgi:hypothetical protein